MVFEQQIVTAAQFDAFIRRPENADKRFELIGGRIVEVPSSSFVSEIAGQILFLIKLFLHQNGRRGHVTGEQGGCQIAGERYAPDVAYLPIEKQAELDTDGYNRVPPDLVVEAVSSDRAEELDRLRIKITNYLAEGIVVWVVKPSDRLVEVHEPGRPVSIYREADTLTGGAVLPGLHIPVRSIFDF